MKTLTLISIVLSAAVAAVAQTPNETPKINMAKRAVLSPSYSCQDPQEFQQGYQQTALFLSDYTLKRNSPDLLFNGACRSENYFESSTHGGNYSVVADLSNGLSGDQLVSLMKLDAQRDAELLKKMGFKHETPVKLGHSYAVLLQKEGVKGLFVFTVTRFVPDQRVEIKYRVIEYQLPEEARVQR